MQTTAELVELAKTGDRDATGELVAHYERVAVAIAWSVVGDFHVAEDIAQESFVLAFRQLSQLRSNASFGPWLLVGVRRKAIQYKNSTTEVTLGLPLSEIVENRESWISDFEEVMPMIDRLPEQEKEVVSFRYLNGLSVRQVAEATQRPVGTVTKQLSRAIRRMIDMASELRR